MKPNDKISIFLVDDDKLFLKSLEIEFIQQGDYNVRTFATGEQCIEHLSEQPDVIILDYHLDGIEENAMNGIDTLEKIKAIDVNIPVVMLSSQDKIEIAVNCMHKKASDYIVKSETAFMRLQKVISSILSKKKMETQLRWYMDRM
jgi:DNA-binding NtrC family response regulator